MCCKNRENMAKLTTYTENQKLEALKLWLVIGNVHQVARDLKIPYDTVKQWRYQKWWQDLAVEIKSEGRLELSAKLRKVAEKALGETLDRLENGDVRLSPTGEKERIPVSAAVASKIATDFLQKSTELEQVQDNQSLQTVNDRLLALATSFEKFSKKVRRIEVEDAVQIEGPDQMDVRKQAGNGEEVGEEDTFDQEITEKSGEG